MSNVRRTKKNDNISQTSTAVLDQPEQPQDERTPEERIQQRIEELSALSFFAMLRDFTEKEWSQHSPIYIYRIEPRVVNADKYAYIDKVRQAIDEDYIRDMPGGGGGVYSLKVNLFESMGKHIQKLVEEKVVIAGTPRYLPGQRFKDNNQPAVNSPDPAPAPAPPQQSPGLTTREGVVDLVKEVCAALERNKGDQNAAIQQVVETMRVGTTATIEMIADAAKRNATSSTGNAIMDKALEAFVQNLTKPAEKQKTLLEQISELKGLMDLMAPPKEKDSKTGLVETVSALKELGVEIGGGSGGWKEQLGTAAIKLVENAPGLIQQFAQMISDNQAKAMQMHRENFERALIAEQVKQGKAVITTVPVAPAVSHIKEPPLPETTTVTPETPGSQTGNVVEFPKQAADINEFMMNKILEFIVIQYNAGTRGNGTADVIDQVFPGALEQMAKHFTDTATVISFAKANAVLKQIASEPDFEEFAGEFITQVQKIVTNGGDGPTAA